MFVSVRELSLIAASEGYSSLQCAGFSLRWLLLLGARALGARASVVAARGLSSCGSQALEHRLSSCGTLGLVAPRHVGSSRSEERRVGKECRSRWSPYH